MLTVVTRTHPGAVRPSNEDTVLWDAELSLVAVADGMGGHNAGEVASATAVDTLRVFLRKSAANQDCTWPFGVNPNLSLEANRMITAVKLANRRVFRDSEERVEYMGMGTTLVAALLQERHVTFVNVGDSRLYLSDGATLRQLSHDDSWIALISKESGLDPAALERHPMRHVLTRVIGARPELEVGVEECDLEDGQSLLFCSDGVYGSVPPETMQDILTKESDLDRAADAMIQAALDARANDNVTVALVAFHDR